nr:hypothetical protein [Dechloromonas agitata]
MNPFGLGLLLAGFVAHPVEIKIADIGAVRQDFMHAPASPRRSTMGVAQTVQFRGNELSPLASATVTPQVPLKYLANNSGFHLVNDQALLDLVLADRDHLGGITKWRTRAIPVALTRVLPHRPQGVLAVFLTLVFVEYRKNLASHLP